MKARTEFLAMGRWRQVEGPQFEGGARRHEGRPNSKVVRRGAGQAATRARSSRGKPSIPYPQPWGKPPPDSAPLLPGSLQGSKALRDVLQALREVVLEVLPGLVLFCP